MLGKKGQQRTISRSRVYELTETEHNVEEDDQSHGDALDEETGLAHPEWARRHVFTTCQKVRCNGTRIRSRGEDDEGPNQISECSVRSETDGTKCAT